MCLIEFLFSDNATKHNYPAKRGEVMNFFMPEDLKEKRKHGHAMLPLETYKLTFEKGLAKIYLHWHAEMEFIYIVAGSGNFKLGLDQVQVTAGDLLVIPPHTIHGAFKIDDTPFSCHSVVFDLKMLQSFQADLTYMNYILPIISGGVSTPFVLRDDDEQRQMVDCINGIIRSNEKKQLAYELELKAELFRLFALLFKNKHLKLGMTTKQAQCNKIDVLKRVVGYIHINYPKKMTINELAQLSGYSEYHFMRFFKLHVAMTVFEYIRTVRLDFAARQLLETDKSITEISFASGFETVTYFTKSFREKYSISPSKYRKNK